MHVREGLVPMSRPTGFPPKVRQIIKDRAGVDGDWVRDEITGAWIPAVEAQIHHRIARGSGSSRRVEVNQPANGIVVDFHTHQRIESERSEALRNGWLISKLTGEQPCSVPVLLHHGWVLLADDGTWEPAEVAA